MLIVFLVFCCCILMWFAEGNVFVYGFGFACSGLCLLFCSC